MTTSYISALHADLASMLAADGVIEIEFAIAHEEILAGLAGERYHSRIRTACGRTVRWTYNSDGTMAAVACYC